MQHHRAGVLIVSALLSFNGAIWSFAQPSKDPCLTLSGTAWTNGEVQLVLTGEASVSYVFESSPDLQSWTPVLTNSDPVSARVVTVDAPDVASFYRASRDPLPLIAYALAAINNINMFGNSLASDSWNSHDDTLSTTGAYDPSKTSTNGDVTSVSGIMYQGNLAISGDLYLGPAAVYSSNAGQVTGTTYNDFNACFPDVHLPTTLGSPLPAPTANTNVGGTVYKYNLQTSGYYSISGSGSILVQPGVTATIKLTSANFAPTNVLILGGMTNSGTLNLYQVSGSATLTGNSGGGCNRPENFWYWGLPGVTNITWIGNTSFIGVVYAPEADLTLYGGGNNISFIGSSTTKTVTMNNGQYGIHYDESLPSFGPVR